MRGDDALGPRVAEAVAALRRPGVRAIACQQLLPEMAAVIADAHTVLFVDVIAAPGVSSVQIKPIVPAAARPALNHIGNSESLLALARDVFGECPPAWTIAIPASNFGLGDPISATADRGAAQALRFVNEIHLPIDSGLPRG